MPPELPGIIALVIATVGVGVALFMRQRELVTKWKRKSDVDER